MKKILVSVLIVLLLVLTYFAIWRGIKFLKINSIKDIKTQSKSLDTSLKVATDLQNVKYPEEKQQLEEAIKQLKIAKQEYENKSRNIGDESSIGALEVKTYKIHYLWTILGNYRKDEGVRSINLDLKSTNTKDVYDLQFKLVGNYVSITDFLYDIEDDDELAFQITGLSIARTDEKVAITDGNTGTATNSIFDNSSNATSTAKTNTTTNTAKTTTTAKTNTGTDVSEGGVILEATFTVQNVGITLD